jgi:hypothetical protein
MSETAQQPDGADQSGQPPAKVRGRSSQRLGATGIPRWLQGQLMRDLAAGERKRSELARELGVERSTITRFAQRHAREIDEIRAHLDDEFAGNWVAQKQRRLDAYRADFELSASCPRADYHEQIRVRSQILIAVAEELGQLPPRNMAVTATVRHVIESVDLEDLK